MKTNVMVEVGESQPRFLIFFKFLGGRGGVALADEDGDSDLEERFGKLIVRFVQII